MSDHGPVKNTDRELYREPDKGNGSYYSDSIFVTEGGGIGINCGGHVIVKPIRDWHNLASQKFTYDKTRRTLVPAAKPDRELCKTCGGEGGREVPRPQSDDPHYCEVVRCEDCDGSGWESAALKAREAGK